VAAAIGQLMLDRHSPAEAVGPLRAAVEGDPNDPRFRSLLERAMREAEK
jgi:Flp pilus assembly protein TadD